MHSVMKRWRWDKSQPVTRATKVVKEGTVKTGRNSCSSVPKDEVSSKGGLRADGIPGEVSTSRIVHVRREAVLFHTNELSRNLRNLNLVNKSLDDSWQLPKADALPRRLPP